MRSTGLVVAFVALVATVRADPPPALIGSTEDGRLLLFHADRPEAARTVRPTGLSGRLVGIDSRPADSHLYGLTTSNDLYRIDPVTGASTLVSTLTVPFDGDLRSGIAFNPQAGPAPAGQRRRPEPARERRPRRDGGGHAARLCAL